MPDDGDELVDLLWHSREQCLRWRAIAGREKVDELKHLLAMKDDAEFLRELSKLPQPTEMEDDGLRFTSHQVIVALEKGFKDALRLQPIKDLGMQRRD